MDVTSLSESKPDLLYIRLYLVQSMHNSNFSYDARKTKIGLPVLIQDPKVRVSGYS